MLSLALTFANSADNGSTLSQPLPIPNREAGWHHVIFAPMWASVREDNLVPLVHQGLGLRVAYERITSGQSPWTFGLALEGARPSTRFEAAAHSVLAHLGMHASQIYPFGSSQRIRHFGGWHTQVDYRLQFFPEWDESHLYWANSFGMGPAYRGEWKPTHGPTWIGTFHAPLVTWFSRPDAVRPYKIDDLGFGALVSSLHDPIDAATWNRAFRSDLSLAACFSLGAHHQQAVSYGLTYQRLRREGGRAQVSLDHRLGLEWFF